MRRTYGWVSSWTAALVAAAGALVIPMTASSVEAAVAPAPHVPVWDRGTEGERYVAMGDSFASGPGIAPMRGDHPFCARSERNFPTLVATGLGVSAFTDASCGGAVLADLSNPQVRGQATHAAQLEAVTPDTTLVTLGTIGGNDVGLVQLAQACMTTPDCVDESPTNPYYQRVEATKEPLRAAIRDVRSRASGADVVVVGYSIYLPYEGCAALSAFVTPAEAAYFQRLVDRLSDAMKQVAEAEGALFADLRKIPGALDHTACAPWEQQWIRSLVLDQNPQDGVSFHPSAAGMAQMAWQVESVVRAERGLPAVPQPTVQPTVPPATTPSPGPSTPPASDATPTAPDAGQNPSPAQVREQLGAAIRDTRLTTRCGLAGERGDRRRVVRWRLRGGEGLVTRVEFRLGTRKIAAKRATPFTLQRRVARLRSLGESTQWRGHRKMRARVTVRSGDVVRHGSVSVARPRCLR